MEKAIKRLFNRLHIKGSDLIMVKSTESVSPLFIKSLYDFLEKYFAEGTVSVIDDCQFNTHVLTKDKMVPINNQERFVLSSGKMMQLLTLDPKSRFVSHPSLMIGSIGKYANYLARPHDLDFPYGKHSVFQDFYDLDGYLLVVGAKHTMYEAKYALNNHDPIIFKNASYQNGSVVEYLDFSCDYDALHTLIFSNGIFLYEVVDEVVIYAVSYRDYINYIEERL
ncbi:MAG TPA: AAC(3) family N-acetyltransferase [Erysipelothrix sp.]